MALLKFDGIRIAGISACVPKQIIDNRDIQDHFTQKEIEKFIKTTGVSERRVAGDDLCTSDLCYSSALKLFSDLGVQREDIDVLIFLSQTPDYHLPATSIILQNRLGLSKNTAAFDVSLGCTGYVYGLAIACSFLQQNNVRKVLLLVGDTPNKQISSKDKVNALLFGDAGTATILEKHAGAAALFFSLNSNGAGENAIKIKAGRYRFPSSHETLQEKTDDDGNIRNDEQVFMDGMEIFNFALSEVAPDIQKLMAFSNRTLGGLDYVVFHQANKFLNECISKQMRLPHEKVLYSIGSFGNTSSASIPLTIVHRLVNSGSLPLRLLLCGFGVGLSWASAIVDLTNSHICDLVEV